MNSERLQKRAVQGQSKDSQSGQNCTIIRMSSSQSVKVNLTHQEIRRVVFFFSLLKAEGRVACSFFVVVIVLGKVRERLGLYLIIDNRDEVRLLSSISVGKLSSCVCVRGFSSWSFSVQTSVTDS